MSSVSGLLSVRVRESGLSSVDPGQSFETFALVPSKRRQKIGSTNSHETENSLSRQGQREETR